jgi:HK97 family phage portal protein
MQKKFYSGHDIVSMHGLESFQNLSMTAQDMQMLEQLGITYDDVARYWGVPRPLLMLDTNSHYTTYTNATLEYLQRTVQPDITEMEQEMNRKLLTRDDFGKRRIHMCEQPLLRLDKEAQAKVDQLQLQTGAATVNEIRAQYDRPSVEGGDTIYVSTNLAELGSPKLSGAQPAPAEPKPEEP